MVPVSFFCHAGGRGEDVHQMIRSRDVGYDCRESHAIHGSRRHSVGIASAVAVVKDALDVLLLFEEVAWCVGEPMAQPLCFWSVGRAAVRWRLRFGPRSGLCRRSTSTSHALDVHPLLGENYNKGIYAHDHACEDVTTTRRVEMLQETLLGSMHAINDHRKRQHIISFLQCTRHIPLLRLQPCSAN